MSRAESPKRVLVLGGAGYLGSVVVSRLLAAGVEVKVLDSLLFGDEALQRCAQTRGCELIRGDIRDISLVKSVMQETDAVVHLAAIVGDGVCEENPSLAIEINRDATASLIGIAQEAKIRRFIFASSCSVYGSSESLVDEDSEVRPLSLYAQTKVDAERILLASISQNFAPTVIRLGTLFGFSKRMRFDLVVNQLVASALSSGLTTIFGGDQWRPFLHVEDASRAFVSCLFQDTQKVAGQIFNAGAERLNHTIQEVGAAVAREIPSSTMSIDDSKCDARSYNVSFARIEAALNFRCKRNLAFGIGEVGRAIREGNIVAGKSQYHNQLAIRHLIQKAEPEVQLWHKKQQSSATQEATIAA